MFSTKTRSAVAFALAVVAAPVHGAPPLSSSDWLSGGPVPAPPASAWRPGDATPADALRRPQRSPATSAEEPAVAESAAIEPVGVTRLDGPDADRLGLQSAGRAGLPADLWEGLTADEAAAAIAAAEPRLPAMSRLLRDILTAQLQPPTRADGQIGTLFLARIDKLLALGEVTTAMALLDAAGPGDAERFQRRFDAALLLGRVDSACAELFAFGGAEQDMGARIFCLARDGDWAAAALSLRGAAGMDLIESDTAALLGAFLDDALADAAEPLAMPDPVTPLEFRLLEAIGQPLPTTSLPLAFAVTDLSPESGLKPRLEAAERLARAGSLSAQRLRALYTEQPPAASGGVWERVAAVQQLDAALTSDDRAATAEALPRAVTAMATAGLIPTLGDMLGKPLAAMQLEGRAGELAFWLALVGGAATEATPLPAPSDAAWLLAVARGEPVGPAGAPDTPSGAAIAAAVTGDAAPPHEGTTASLLLRAMADADAGLDGDMARASAGIAGLRSLGLEDAARAAALQLIVLPRLLAASG